MMPRFTTSNLNDFFSGTFTLSNVQTVNSKLTVEKKPKYLLEMDLDDKEADARAAREKCVYLQSEIDVLRKWGFGGEIPSELEKQLSDARSEWLSIKEEVKQLELEVENYED